MDHVDSNAGPELEEHMCLTEARLQVFKDSELEIENFDKFERQFRQAVQSARKHGNEQRFGVIERVNELLLMERLASEYLPKDARIIYESPISEDGASIDFQIVCPDGTTIFLEVKTVHPRSEDSERNWDRHQDRKKYIPNNIVYGVEKDSLGAEIAQNDFAARSKFMEYTQEFEAKLELAKKSGLQVDNSTLVFCGNGFKWHNDQLEDFVCFYITGAHGEGDPFGPMESYGKPELRRNIHSFGSFLRDFTELDGGKYFRHHGVALSEK